MSRPNILLVTSDQQHWRTIGAFSKKIHTPNLDRLCRMGINFSRAYCPNPTCTPTRASIITGLWPSAHGAWTLGTKLPEHVPTVGAALHQAGYVTTLIGKAHFQPLKSTPEFTSVESYPTLRDLEFWRTFNERHTPWYGFDHVETARMHGDEPHVGQHYALWMEEKGLKNWREYFQPWKEDPAGVCATPHAPPIAKGPGYGWRSDGCWKLPAELHYTAWTGQRTIAAIESAVGRKQPFFIWSSYHDPHPPYCVPEPWASMYKPEDMESEIGEYADGEFDRMTPLHRLTRQQVADFAAYNEDGRGSHGCHSHVIDRSELLKACAIYYGMISFMDHWIGQTLDALERLNQLQNTLIVFTSDHGHFLGQHGLVAKGPFHYEDVIRVPMIAAWKGTLPEGRTTADMQTLVDYAPSFLEAAGLHAPINMQGRSQLKSWRGDARPRDAVIVENHHNGAAVHLRTLVTSRWKLTLFRGREWGELFDLQNDPNELRNLFDDPAHAQTRANLSMQMIQADLAREYTGSPRISGA